MRYLQHVRNTTKDGGQRHLERWQNSFPERRTRAEAYGRNRVCCQQEVVSANHMPVRTLQIGVLILHLDFNKILKSPKFDDDNEIELTLEQEF